MSDNKKPQFELKSMDLFMFRRIENNEELPLLRSNSKIYKTGLSIGGGLISLVLFLSVLLIVKSFFYRVQREKLKPFVIEYDNLTTQIQIKKNFLNNLRNSNKILSDSISSIRSGSAIIKEISNTIPASIILTKINIEENILEIKGSSKNPKSYELINVFILELIESQLIKNESVRLIVAKNSNKNKSNQDKENTDKVDFVINAQIIDNVEKINKDYLRSLKSFGLYKRIKTIQSLEI